jgi:IS30 family transposase
MARKIIDENVKKKISEAHANGEPMRKIAKEFGVSVSSVHRIVKGETAETSRKTVVKTSAKEERKKRIKELEKKISRLEKKILEIENSKKS